MPRRYLWGVLSVFLIACSEPEEQTRRHLEQADTFFDQGEYAKARVELKRALQLDPKRLEGRDLLARIHERERDWRPALRLYSEIAQENPQYIGAWLGMARLWLQAGLPDRALQAAETALDIDPHSPDALTLSGTALDRLDDDERALEAAAAALEWAPGHLGAASLASKLEADAGRLPEAIALLKDALAANPDAPRLRVYLAELHARAGQHAPALDLLQEMASLEPEQIEHHMRLAIYHVALGDSDSAELALRAAIEARPDDSDVKLALAVFLASRRDLSIARRALLEFLDETPSAVDLRFALASLHETAGEIDQAREVYEDIIEQSGTEPPGLAARTRLIPLLEQEDAAEAERLVAAVLAKDPSDKQALLQRAELALGRGDLDQSIGDARAALRGSPDYLPAWRFLARVYGRNGQQALAAEALTRVLDANPGDIESRLELAALMIGFDQLEDAAAHLEAVLEAEPGHFRALRSLAELRTRQSDWRAAERAAERIVATYSERTHGYFALGRVYQESGQIAESIEQFEAALELAPESDYVLAALAQSYVIDGQPQQALERIETALDHDPGNAKLHSMRGELLLRLGKVDGATSAFESAIEAHAAWPVAYQHLAKVYLDRNLPARAIEVYHSGLEATGGDETLAFQLAAIHEKLGAVGEAAALYEEILARNPGSELAANNLAMLLTASASDPDDLDRAFGLVRQFEGSDDPYFLDTLGWVQFKRGQLPQAVAVLEQAAKKAPDLPEISYHLAMTYREMGRIHEARAHLEKALSSGQPFPEALVLRDLLSEAAE